MAKYRKKPIIVEAIQWQGDNLDAIGDFISTNIFVTKIGDILLIPTLNGKQEAIIGDYIIHGSQGEYYPCKPQIFLENYEIMEG